MTAVILKDKWVMIILTGTQIPPTEGNFCDKQGKLNILSLLKTIIVVWVGYSDKGDRMADSYSIN
jgi:hypothetical protein